MQASTSLEIQPQGSRSGEKNVAKERRKMVKGGALLSWLWIQENLTAGGLIPGEVPREACGSTESDSWRIQATRL